MSSATRPFPVFGPVIVKFTSSNPMVLPVLLTSVSWLPKFVLLKLMLLFVTAVNFSVCVVLCALATAGSTSAPVPLSTTAAPAATMDLRIFMIPLLPAWAAAERSPVMPCVIGSRWCCPCAAAVFAAWENSHDGQRAADLAERAGQDGRVNEHSAPPGKGEVVRARPAGRHFSFFPRARAIIVRELSCGPGPCLP